MRRFIAIFMLLSLPLLASCGEDTAPGDSGQTGINENEGAEEDPQGDPGGEEGEAESETEVETETELETETEGEGDTGEGAEENDDGVDY